MNVSIWPLRMKFTLLDDTDVSHAYAAYLRELRKQAKLSRAALAERSCVPAATIKKFELTGPTIGKNSSEEDIQMIYHGAPERRNELMQSGMVLMQSIAKGDGGDNRTPKQSSMFGHY